MAAGAAGEVWRIASARYAGQAFDGEGARLYGGRWNHAGVLLVYTSESLSLSALEFFVNLEPALAPAGLVAASASVPADLPVRSIGIAELPAGWRNYPAPEALKDLGTAWARGGETAALWVPSAVIPRERNLLLNPRHPDFGRIRILPAEPFSFDPRMWKS